MAYVLSTISRKGGVGKTTSVLCLGAGLADRGKKVLLLDLDAQGSLSIAMGCDDPDRILVTMADVFLKKRIPGARKTLLRVSSLFPTIWIIFRRTGGWQWRSRNWFFGNTENGC